MFRLIGFGIRVWGCLYVGYWAIFFGSVAFLIISSYLKQHRDPTARSVPHEMQQHHHK
jgi:hypothetical protein